MARTRASVGTKVSSGKSSKARCSVAPPTSSPAASGSSSKASSSSGGNPACPRETPKWQKPITKFFVCMDSKQPDSDDDDDREVAESSKPTSSSVFVEKEITVDNTDKQTPSNTVLDESIDLEPLNGESCHKIEEFFPKNGVKGKGLGKKTKGKENKRNSSKRELDDVDEGNDSKKVKLTH